MQIKYKKLIPTLLTVALALVLLAAMPLTAYADDASALATIINSFAHGGTATTPLNAVASGNIVTVTGNVTHVTNALVLNIDSGVKILWKAAFSGSANGLINLADSSGGMLEIAAGGSIVSSDNITIYVPISTACSIIVSGGTVSNTGADGKAIRINAADIKVAVGSGTVSATGAGGAAISAVNTRTTIDVNGGTVSSAGANTAAIWSDGADATIRVSGNGTVNSTGAASCAIYSTSTNAQITMSSGTVSSTTWDTISVTGADAKVTVEGGVLSSGDRNAIFSSGDNATITISAGTLKTDAASI